MANSQTILWTALPNGVTGTGEGRLAIFIAPRLLTDDPTTTLDAFPDFVDWPRASPCGELCRHDRRRGRSHCNTAEPCRLDTVVAALDRSL